MTALSTTFTYNAIEPSAAAIAQAAANLIRINLRKQVDAVVAVGQQLIAVKDALKHGQFGAWLKAENLFAETTAQNFMRVAKEIGSKTAIVADLPLALVYRMSSPLVPEETRQEILSRREAGDDVDKKEIDEIVSTAIWKAKQEAKAAAEEERRSPAARSRRKAAQKKEQDQRERAREERERRETREQEAADRASLLVVDRLSADDKVELITLLDDVWPHQFFDALKNALASGGAQ